MESLMDIRIIARHFDLTDSLRDYAQQKLARVLRHCEVLDVSIIMDCQKVKERAKQHHIEVSVHVKGRKIIANDFHFDMYAAIDSVTLKLDRQLVKINRIRHDHHHDKHMKVEMMQREVSAQLSAQSDGSNQQMG